MAEIGEIKEIHPETDQITIEFDAKGFCKSCGICLAGSDKSLSLMKIKVKNNLQAKLGDKVEFKVKEGETIKASLMLYAFPLGMLLLGFVIGQIIAGWFKWSPDLVGLLFAGLFFAGAFNILNKLDKSKKTQSTEHIQLIRIL